MKNMRWFFRTQERAAVKIEWKDYDEDGNAILILVQIQPVK